MASFGIRHGVGLISKLKIFLYSLQSVIPLTLRKRFDWIDRGLSTLTPDFSGVTIESKGCRYELIDPESLYIIAFHEDWMEKFLVVNRGDVFLDVGAHLGKYSLPLSRIASRVVAVEADPENCECLKRNIKLNEIENVTVVNLVAWNRSEVLRFYLADFKGHGTVKQGLPDRRYVNGYIDMRAEAMDDVLRSLGVSRVDCIKVDVEGAEYEVFRGLRETLTKHRPRIVAEIMKSNVERVLPFMEGLGYDAEPIKGSDTPLQIYYSFNPLGSERNPCYGLSVV